MKAQVGDKVVRHTGFGASVFVLLVRSRTDRTIATALGETLQGATPMDQRLSIEQFRAYDKLKVDRIEQLAASIEDAKLEARELFDSLPRIE